MLGRLAESAFLARAKMKKILALIPVAFLAACAAPMPSGPSVMVLPGSGKSFDSFRFDDYECRQFASTQLNGATPEQASENAAGRSAALGAVVGGLAGAALGGNSRGLVTGTAIGTAGGAIAGTGAGQASGRSLQQRYDFISGSAGLSSRRPLPTSMSRDSASRLPSTGSLCPMWRAACST